MEMLLSLLIMLASILDVILLSESIRLRHKNIPILFLIVIGSIILSVLWGIATLGWSVERIWICAFMAAGYYVQSIIRFSCFWEMLMLDAKEALKEIQNR